MWRRSPGLGGWPQAATLEHFLSAYGGTIPDGLPRTVVPGAPGAWLAGLDRFGTLGFAEIAEPAIRLAKEGCPVTKYVASSFAQYADAIARMPSSAATYFRNNAPPRLDDVLVLEELAGTLTFLADADRAARPGGRSLALRAVHDAIYKGDIGSVIAAYHRDNGGLLTRADLATYNAEFAPAIVVPFLQSEIAVCGPWCQSPVLAQLAMLNSAQFDRDAARNVDPEGERFVHFFIETVKLAMADRTAYIGDPRRVDVPMDAMLHPKYIKARCAMIDECAMSDMPPPGDPRAFSSTGDRTNGLDTSGDAPASANTAGIAVVDREGNLCSATVSDVAVDTPVIPGLGSAVSSRGSQGWLDPLHPGVVEPGRRPWLTAAPTIVHLSDGAKYAIASAGGDVQPQAMLQTLIRILCGTRPQAAVDAARAESRSFPDAFWPHTYQPNLMRLESGLAHAQIELEQRGHLVQVVPDRDPRLGAVVFAGIDARGIRMAAADVRRDAIAAAR